MSKCLALTIFALVVFLPLSASAGVWATRPDVPTVPGFGMLFTRFDAEYSPTTGKVYFLGGRRSDGTTDGSIWSYDPVTLAYTDTGVDLPVPISNYHILRLTDGAGQEVLMVFAGRDANGVQTTAVQGYVPATNSTVNYTSTDPYPIGITPGSCEAVNNIAYCFGGFNGTAVSAATYIFDILAPAGSRFTAGPNLTLGRGYIISGVVGGFIYAAGGDTYDGTNLIPQTRVERLDTSNPVAWDDVGVADMPIACDESPGFGFEADFPSAELAGKFITAGCGQWPNEIVNVMAYDVATNTWDQAFPDLNLTRRNHAGAVIPTGCEKGMWVWGGRYTADTTLRATPEFYAFNILDVEPPTLPNGFVGIGYNQTITADCGAPPYTFSVSVGALPAGLTLDANTGVISGSPTTVETADFTITVTDNGGLTGERDYSMSIENCPAITIDPATLPDGAQGTYYYQALTGGGGVEPYLFELTTGTLPAGLNFDGSGVIWGTPTTIETQTFTVTATDSNGCSGTIDYTLIITGCPPITIDPATVPNGFVGSPYSQALNGAGGTGPYTWALTAGNLPAGLTFDTGTATISGTPTTIETASFSITATDADLCSGTQAYSITVTCPAITIIPNYLMAGVVGTAYDQTVHGSGGVAPYSYAVTAGSLPPGLSLDPGTGNVSGVPTTTGSYPFSITATDSGGCTGSQAYTLAIDCPIITLDPPTLPDGLVGTAYDQTVSASGGTAPYSYVVQAGALPAGLTLDSLTGAITGVPTAVEVANFTIGAHDNYGCGTARAYTVNITCAVITLTPATLPDGNVNVAYDQAVTAAGGAAPYTYTVSAGNLPAGLSLDASTGAITGTPTAVEAANFTILATDNNGCIGSQAYTINIAAQPCLFCDDFNNATIDPWWTIIKPNWTETTVLTGTPAARKAIIVADGFAGCLNCYEETQVTIADTLYSKVWLLGWYHDKKNTMELLIKEGNDKIILRQRVDGRILIKNKGLIPITPGVPITIRVTYDGTQFVVSVNGTDLFTLHPVVSWMSEGTVGFAVKNTTASFDYITVNQ